MIETTRSFSALIEEFVEVTARHDPVTATDIGIHDYDHQLPDDSPSGFLERGAWANDFSRRLESTAAGEELSATQRVDLGLLRSRIAALQCGLEDIGEPARNPVRYVESALTGVLLLLIRPFAPIEERKEAILSRLMAVPDYLRSARENLVQVPEVLIEIASEVSLAGLAFVDETTRTLVRNFPAEAERIEHAGERARMGFLQYQSVLERELKPRAGGSVAIGERAMNRKLSQEHLLSMDCRAIDQVGHEAIARAREALETEARRIDPSRSWREQVAEARQRHPDPLRVRAAYVAEVERARRFTVERSLAPVPDGRLEVVETPGFLRAVVPIATYHRPAPLDPDQTGSLFVTPVDPSKEREEQEQQLEGHCFARIPIVAVHEAWPGHHLQCLHANRSGSRLRRIATSPVFAEGWALYCEELMSEQGFFPDPVTRLFRLRDLLLRACRVVIDVGLHSERMTFEQAVSFLVDEAMVERMNAVGEVRGYALRPTQPMSFLVGRNMVLELREEAKRRLGLRFDPGEFHAALLSSGALPPALVREELWERLEVG